jgi:hypothetical protein
MLLISFAVCRANSLIRQETDRMVVEYNQTEYLGTEVSNGATVPKNKSEKGKTNDHEF